MRRRRRAHPPAESRHWVVHEPQVFTGRHRATLARGGWAANRRPPVCLKRRRENSTAWGWGQARCAQGAAPPAPPPARWAPMHHAIQVVAPIRRARAAVGQRHARLAAWAIAMPCGVYVVVGHIQHCPWHWLPKPSSWWRTTTPKRLGTPLCSHCCTWPASSGACCCGPAPTGIGPPPAAGPARPARQGPVAGCRARRAARGAGCSAPWQRAAGRQLGREVKRQCRSGRGAAWAGAAGP